MGEKPMIYYLAHPYSTHPEQSFFNAVNWTKQLRMKGLTVFSPILHTHSYYEELEDGWHLYKDVREYMKSEDYVAWDLAILEEFKKVTVLLSKTAYEFACPHCNRSLDLSDTRDEEAWCSYCDSWELIEDKKWLSRGCRQEYEFAKTHHIKVLELEAFLAGEEKEI